MKFGSNSKNLVNICALAVNCLSLISSFIIIINNNYRICFLLPMTPVLFIVGLNLIVFKYSSIVTTMVGIVFFIGFFFRMVISPLMLSVSEYSTRIVNNVALNYMNQAVILIMVEYFVCVIFLMISNTVRGVVNPNYIKKVGSEHMSIISKGLVYVIFASVAFTVIMYPSYLISLDSIIEYFTMDRSQIIAKNMAFDQMRKDTSRVLYQVFDLGFYFLQVLFPAYLLSKYSELFLKSNISKNSKRKGVAFIFFVIIISFSILTADVAKNVFLLIAIIYSIYSVYPNKIKRFIPVLCIGGGIVVFLLLISKLYVPSERKIGFNELSKVVNAYFAGITNISCGIGVTYDDKLTIFFGDIMRSIPLVAHFFKNYTTSQILYNNFLYGAVGKTDQIMPLICYGYHYLGIFAPLLSVLVYKQAFKFEKKFRKTSSVFSKILYGYVMVCFAVCPSMYMLSSVVRIFFYSIVFNFIARSNERQRFKTEIGYEHNSLVQ